jgi:hypothetical protein
LAETRRNIKGRALPAFGGTVSIAEKAIVKSKLAHWRNDR